MNPALDNCPVCGMKLKVFYRLATQECVAYCPNGECRETQLGEYGRDAKFIEGTGDKTEDAKAMFHGLCLKRGLMKKGANA